MNVKWKVIINGRDVTRCTGAYGTIAVIIGVESLVRVYMCVCVCVYAHVNLEGRGERMRTHISQKLAFFVEDESSLWALSTLIMIPDLLMSFPSDSMSCSRTVARYVCLYVCLSSSSLTNVSHMSTSLSLSLGVCCA